MRLVRLSRMVGAAMAAIFALAALQATAGAPSFGFGSRGGGSAQAPACVPVPAAECGSVRVPLFRSKPAGRAIDIGYVLIHHRDRLKAWSPDDPETRSLQLLVEHRRRLVGDRTRISNRLTALRRQYTRLLVARGGRTGSVIDLT